MSRTRVMFAATVVPEGGEPFYLEATSRDVYVWEKSGRGRSMEQLKQGSFQAQYELAHVAAKRQQLFAGSLQEFTDTCDLEFDPDEGEPEEADPTRGGASG